ncbi:hypothetical protein MUU53_19725 [Rhizobium lemnae]|uniref:DUF403 domain-containing protein n=1 Tax=Rhizobium lemnae TaxID=1214924 RepID=A0ABV8EFA2_9HYPH|nr:hypothetical protein [Rhizobium lemnae]MCJ8510126.1 hypothetical protein [Rhizobium lemnae]
MQKAEPIALDPLERRVLSLREGLEMAVQQLAAADCAYATALEGIDACLLEWRWVESQFARLTMQLDRHASAVIRSVAGRSQARRKTLLRRLFRLSGDRVYQSDEDAAHILADTLVQRHRLLLMIQNQREFLAGQLFLLEAELARRFAELQAIPLGAGKATEELGRRIDMLQDLADGVIGMTASANLIYNKNLVDAEASILALTSLETLSWRSLAEALHLLQTLFQRAERGLLSVRGIAHRKTVIDETFQRKLATTRQARH